MPFAKLDTFQSLLESIMKCEGADRIDLIIWHDGISGSFKETHFAPAWQSVTEFIDSFVKPDMHPFRSVEVHKNDCNIGPYRTYQAAMDYAFVEHSFAVLIEDDMILSRDALVWFSEVRDLGQLQDESVWAIAVESPFLRRTTTIGRAIVCQTGRGSRFNAAAHQ